MKKLFGFVIALGIAASTTQVDARYIEADPLGLVDGASVYGYALQNPGRYVDPRGELCSSYRGRDGNTYIKCTGRTTYCPGGDCGTYSPRNNNRLFAQCMTDCETALKKTGRFVGCTAAGVTVGSLTGTSVAGSAVVSTGCKIIVSEAQCGAVCERETCGSPYE